MKLGIRFAALLVILVTSVSAATLAFDTNPLVGDPALTTPGRQIVNGGGGGPIFSFDPATDVIAFQAGVFGITSVDFFNGDTTAPGFPSPVTVAVVRNASAAGAAANALAAQITTSGPGLFVYFNAGLDVPRLVYTTDLSSEEADLAILARFNNLSGQPDSLGSITAANFSAVPEPSSILLTSSVIAAAGIAALRRRLRRK